MVRRTNDRELNPEDFLETNEETEEPDKIIEIFREVKRSAEDDVVEANGMARPPEELTADQAEEA